MWSRARMLVVTEQGLLLETRSETGGTMSVQSEQRVEAGRAEAKHRAVASNPSFRCKVRECGGANLYDDPTMADVAARRRTRRG